jgi:formylglycine-generating enzyme required for sulfatase activity
MKIISFLLIVCLNLAIAGRSFAIDFDLTGKVETKRKGNIITIVFKEKPENDIYLIIENNTVIGKLKILDLKSSKKNNILEYKAIAEFSLQDMNQDVIKTGTFIGLLKEKKQENTEYGEINLNKKVKYKKKIVNQVDNKEMMLIPEGKFVFGSNTGDKDEAPQQIIFLDNYYIDKCEVSNAEYYIYMLEVNAVPPASWANGEYPAGEEDLPVIVAYFEAIGYAKWAKKRLPTEKEWEKAARGTGLELVKKQDESYIYIEKPNIYPWGNQFDPLKANCAEYWQTISNENETKKPVNTKGKLLPLKSFENTGNSVYGIVNMAGNAGEWTSSWYDAYKDSKFKDKKFGTQFKVIRGGSWFNTRHELRTTSRSIGGLPNLYTDNIAGFRCVKDPVIQDTDGNNE